MPVLADDQSVDVRKYVDINDFCSIADGYTIAGSAYDDDIPVICGFDFLEFTGMILPPILFAKSAPMMVMSLPVSMSALSRCFLYITVMLVSVDRLCICWTC